MSSLAAFVLAAAGGVLCFLGFVGFGYWPLALVCMVPLWQALEIVRGTRLRAALLLGFTFGWVAYAGGYHWMWRIVDVFLDGDTTLGALLFLADSSWFALRFAVYGALYTLARRRGWPIAAAAVPALLTVEWLYPLLFPVYLGHSLSSHLPLMQIADLGGPLLMTGLLALINVAVFETWRWARGARTLPAAAWSAAVLAVGLSWAYGIVRVREIDVRSEGAPALRVGLVQANLGVHEKGVEALRDHERYLEQTRELLAGGDVDLVIWPETVHSHGLLGPLPISGRLVRQDVGAPLLFGAAFVRGDTGRQRRYNSALLVGADGVIRSGYDKTFLVPFTEYIPFAESFPALAARLPDASRFSPGTGLPALALGPWRISTPICHEATQAALVRRMVEEAQPHLIATLANDSWFGDSQEPWLHLAMARMRAVENRRWVVRATNSGVSAVIDPAGRVIARSGLQTRENLRATVHLLDDPAIYTRWGDWPGWLAAALTLALILLPRTGSNHHHSVS